MSDVEAQPAYGEHRLSALAVGEAGLVLRLEVGPEDVGKVIGRQGRTARALRALLSAAGHRARKRYTLEIIE